jgi:hypothetical protein
MRIENSTIPRVKRDMSTREALILVSLCYSSKRVGWPFDIRRLYIETFGKLPPTENMYGVAMEKSISYDQLKDELFEKAVEILAEKIDK